MFKFVKSLFSVQQQIKLSELPNWIEKNLIPEKEKISKSAKSVFEEFNNIKEEMHRKVLILESAEIHIPVDEKIKNIVLGHRQTYIRVLTQYILSIKTPELTEPESLTDFCTLLSIRLDNLSRDSLKSYYATQHLFAESLEPIAAMLKSLANLQKNTSIFLNENRWTQLKKIKEIIDRINSSKIEKIKLKEKISEEEEKIKSVEKQKEECLNKLNALKNSEGYNDYTNLTKKLEEAVQKSAAVKNEILNAFSNIESALKKFARISLENQELIEAYSSDPVSALIQDKDLIIIKIFEKIIPEIESERLELKEKKKENALNAINSLNLEKLKAFTNKYIESKEEEQRIHKNMRINDSVLKLKDCNYKIEHYNNTLVHLQNNIKKLKENLSEDNTEELTIELEKKIIEFNLPITLS